MRHAHRYLYTAHSALIAKPGHETAAHHFIKVVDKVLGRKAGELGSMIGMPAVDHVLALRRDPGRYRFEFIASSPLAARELRLLELNFTAMNHDAPCEAAFRWDLEASDPALRNVLEGRPAVQRVAAASALH